VHTNDGSKIPTSSGERYREQWSNGLGNLDVDLTSWAVEVERREDEDDGFECPSRSRSVGDGEDKLSPLNLRLDSSLGEECFLQLLGEETARLTELADEKRSNCV
jgi:hypothetical protein